MIKLHETSQYFIEEKMSVDGIFSKVGCFGGNDYLTAMTSLNRRREFKPYNTYRLIKETMTRHLM